MEEKQGIRLYNLIFPIWLLWVFPLTWIVVLPANFIIDSLVVLITLRLLEVGNIKQNYKKAILKVWGFGFLSDFIGTAFMVLALLIDHLWEYDTAIGKWWYDYIAMPVSYNAFESIWSIIWVTICVIISSFCIYIFNYKISFRKLEMEEGNKKKLAIALAVFTAPFLFYIPTSIY
nr:hypothetical protein [uncultured Cellulosilyticum sp.]